MYRNLTQSPNEATVRIDTFMDDVESDLNQLIMELASIGCTPEEIIAELDLSNTLDSFLKEYEEIMNKGLLKYRVRIKKAQSQIGLDDPQALKWLAQVYLGQTDKHIEKVKEKGKYEGLSREELIALLKVY